MTESPSLGTPFQLADSREVLAALQHSLHLTAHRLHRRPELTLQELYNALNTTLGTPTRALSVIERAARKHCAEGRGFVELRRKPSQASRSLERTIAFRRPVTACDLHPSRSLVAAALGASVVLCDSISGVILGQMDGHGDRIHDCRFTADGETLITASADGLAIVWDLTNLAPALRLEGHDSVVNACDASPCGRFLGTGSEDHMARLWDRTTGQCRHVLEGHEYAVTCCRFHPSNGFLLTGSMDRTLRLWDIETGGEVRRFALPGSNLKEGFRSLSGIEALAFSADGSRFAAASTDGVLAWWDIHSSQPQQYMVQRGPRLSCCAISDPSLFLAAGNDHHLLVWREGDELPAKRIRAHAGPINGLSTRPGTGTVVSCGEDGMMRLWDARSLGSGHREPGHERAVSVAVACPGQNGHALTAGHDGRVILWDETTGAALRQLGQHDRAVSCAAIGADGHVAVSADEAGDVLIWHLENPDAGFVRMHVDAPVLCCSVSPKSGLVACGDLDGCCHVWDPARGTKLTLALHQDSIRSCDFMSDEALLTTSDDGRILLSTLDGSAAPDVLGEGLRVSCRAVGRDIAVLCARDRVGVFRAHARARLGLRLPFSNCGSCSLTEDGSRAVIGGEWAIAIVRTETAELCTLLQCPHDPVVCVFLAGGRRVAAGSSTGEVRFWNVDTEQECGLFDVEGGITVMAADPSRNSLLVGAANGETYMLEMREGR
jgi:WD40 repeat protein